MGGGEAVARHALGARRGVRLVAVRHAVSDEIERDRADGCVQHWEVMRVSGGTGLQQRPPSHALM